MKVIVFLIEVGCMKQLPGLHTLEIKPFLFFFCFGWILAETYIKLSDKRLICFQKVQARYDRALARFS